MRPDSGGTHFVFLFGVVNTSVVGESLGIVLFQFDKPCRGFRP